MILILYQFLSIILSYPINLYLLIRKLRKKEDCKRFPERLGFSKYKRPDGFLILLHCASVGESKSAITLAKALLGQNPSINIIITSGTVTSAIEIVKDLPERVVHQYIPVDKFFAVKKFLSHWKPNSAIFVESELWPNLITQIKKSGCSLILVNGRVSDESFRNWKIAHKLGFNLLKNFSLCFAQSLLDKEKFINLGASNVHFFGSLKNSSQPLKVDQSELINLRHKVGIRKIWLSASTHKGEEEIAIKTHQKLKESFPDLLTIIVPRHPNRMGEIIKLIPRDIRVSVRSKNQSIDNCDLYLADTMGELGIFYSLSKISLIGGSMIDGIGGHNPFEALQLGSIILSGCYVDNFKENYQDLARSESCLMVKNELDLFFNLQKLISSNDYQVSILENMRKQNSRNESAVERIAQKMWEVMRIK